MLPGVFEAKKKDRTIYYRSNLTFKNKHISLGSYDSEAAAHQAYRVASSILTDTASIEDSYYMTYALPFEKIVSLINFRDNNMYISTMKKIRNYIRQQILKLAHHVSYIRTKYLAISSLGKYLLFSSFGWFCPSC